MNHLLYLRTFLETYRSGSLTRGAERLGITQPAASGHIAALEAMMGRPLFRRQARGVTPTPAAEDLARAIAAPLDGIEATMGAARARSSQMTGAVHLVGPAEYLSARIAPLVAPLAAEGLRFRIQTGDRERIYAALADGQADLAVTASRPDTRRVGFTRLDTERLVLVAAPDIAARAKARTVSAAFLSGLPCVAYGESLALIRPFFDHVFGVSCDLQAAATAPDLRVLIGMAQAGTGWTVLPDYLCPDALAQGRLVELPTDRPGPDNGIYLAWNASALRQPRLAHVRDYLLRSTAHRRAAPAADRRGA